MRRVGIGILALTLAACGGGGGGTPQEDGGLPTPQIKHDGGVAAAADFGCVGTSTDCTLPFYAGVTCPPDPGFTVSGEVQDFQSKEVIVTAISSNAVATVTVYETTADVLSDTPLAGPLQTDASGRYSVTIPKSLTRVIFKTTMSDSKDTYQFGQLIKPDQTDNDRYIISNATGDFINAWVGVPFDTAKGAIAGALRDCGHVEVANAVGTAVDPTSGADVIPETQIFYFSAAAGLPVKRTQRTASDYDGRMLFLNVPPTTGGVKIQAFVNDGTGALERVAESVVPVMANSIVIAELDPLGPGQ